MTLDSTRSGHGAAGRPARHGEYGEEREHGGKGARLHSPFFVEVFAGSARDRIVLSTL
jgi:hypothetical protein